MALFSQLPMHLFTRCWALVVLALSLIFAASPAAAASTVSTASTTASTASPTVYNSSAATTASKTVRQYAYQGCYLEITGTNGTAAGSRSLEGGADEVLPGNMTVPICLAFCGTAAANGTTAYSYAGLEYGRECWCSQDLSGLATQEPAADCDLPCDGDSATLCGGNLRLNVYMLGAASSKRPAHGPLWAAFVATAAAVFMQLL